jgi:hypothetical protein
MVSNGVFKSGGKKKKFARGELARVRNSNEVERLTRFHNQKGSLLNGRPHSFVSNGIALAESMGNRSEIF